SVVRNSSPLLNCRDGARPVSVRSRRRGKPRLYGKSNALAPQIGAPSQMHERPTTDDQRLPSIRQRRSLRGPAFGGKILTIVKSPSRPHPFPIAQTLDWLPCALEPAPASVPSDKSDCSH